jgi:hypothetical protein
MKAIKYIKPETKIFKVELQQMIADSPANQQLNPNDPAPITEEEQIGARGFTFFEESEEE